MALLAVTDVLEFRVERGGDDRRLGDHRHRQRSGLHRDRRDRRAVLERVALGAQNTSQLLATGLTPPVFGALITAAGYPAAFLVCALFPVLAIPLVPADQPGRPTEPRGVRATGLRR